MTDEFKLNQTVIIKHDADVDKKLLGELAFVSSRTKNIIHLVMFDRYDENHRPINVLVYPNEIEPFK